MSSFIPYGRQSVTDEDIQAVVEVLKSDFITQGPEIPAFEKAVAEKVNAKYAVAFCNATAALHALYAYYVKEGDLVLTTPITFVSTANAALFNRGVIDFVDIDLNTFNMSPESLDRKLKDCEKNGKLPSLIAPVHLCGTPADMKKIYEVASQYKIPVIEDASHAIGAEYLGKPVGSCEFSEAAVFSFHPVKIITTGEGGLITTNNEEIYKFASQFRTHGITKNPEEMNQVDGPWYHEMKFLGYNYRITDMQAALGLSQLKRLDQIVEKRNELVATYREKLTNLPVTCQLVSADALSAFHLMVVRIETDSVKRSKKQIFDNMIESGIGVNLHYIPVYKQPFYQSLGFSYDYCENAETYYRQAISLPMYPELSAEEVTRVVDSLQYCLN